jgi:type I restriction enzyme S subunit
MVRTGAAKPFKQLLPVSEDEVPNELPSSWKWVRTETICEAIVDCPHSTPVFIPSGIVCLDTNGFKEGQLIPHKIRFVSEETYQDRVRRLVPRADDIVFAREGSVGASVIVPENMRCCLGQRVMLFRLLSDISPRFFSMALSEASSLERLLSLHKGIGAKHVNVADMRNALLPLPPLAEQRRIMAKVEQLMALVDALETQLAASRTAATELMEAVVCELTTQA